MPDLWRGALWGLAAAGALMVAVYAATTPTGHERLTVAVNQARDLVLPSAAKSARQMDVKQNQLLAEGLRVLTADRDRLQSRVTTLERSLQDVTASVARNEKAQTAPVMPAAPQTGDEVTASIQAPAMIPQAAPAKPEFGLDLGGANTMEGLRALWTTARQRHGTLLEGLRPIVYLRERARPGVVDMRLVAGPIPNAATAARMCATLVAAGAICQPSPYDGQRLAVR
jgi:hypothetical protein